MQAQLRAQTQPIFDFLLGSYISGTSLLDLASLHFPAASITPPPSRPLPRPAAGLVSLPRSARWRGSRAGRPLRASSYGGHGGGGGSSDGPPHTVSLSSFSLLQVPRRGAAMVGLGPDYGNAGPGQRKEGPGRRKVGPRRRSEEVQSGAARRGHGGMGSGGGGLQRWIRGGLRLQCLRIHRRPPPPRRIRPQHLLIRRWRALQRWIRSVASSTAADPGHCGGAADRRRRWDPGPTWAQM